MAKTRSKRKVKTKTRPGSAIPDKLEETLDGTVLYNVPFPEELSELNDMAPIIIQQLYHIEYVHSYGQDSPFFAGLANKKLLGSECKRCDYRYATPRGHCMYCGARTDWFELPQEGRIHTFTVCHFGGEAFLPECPFILALVEWDGVDTLFLARVIGLDTNEASKDWVGMKIRAKFKRLSEFKPTDVYFVPAE